MRAHSVAAFALLISSPVVTWGSCDPDHDPPAVCEILGGTSNVDISRGDPQVYGIPGRGGAVPAFPEEWFDRDRMQSFVGQTPVTLRLQPREIGGETLAENMVPPLILEPPRSVGFTESRHGAPQPGRVVLQGRVKTNGRLGSIKSVWESRRSLRSLAITAAQDARFEPGTIDGRAVAVPVYLTVEFSAGSPSVTGDP